MHYINHSLNKICKSKNKRGLREKEKNEDVNVTFLARLG